MKFTVRPSGVGALPRVVFDVTRQKETRAYFVDQGGVTPEDPEYWPGRTAFSSKGPVGNEADRATDDPNNSDEDNGARAKDNIYSVDAPGIVNNGEYEQVISYANFLEYVRVRFDGEALHDNSNDGSRCSPKESWHNVFWVVKKEASIGDVTRTAEGTGTCALAGTPTAFAHVVIEFTEPGRLGTAKYKLSGDAGKTWSAEKVLPNNGVVECSGVTVTFSNGDPPDNSFRAGDKYAFDILAKGYKLRDGKVSETERGYREIPAEQPQP